MPSFPNHNTNNNNNNNVNDRQSSPSPATTPTTPVSTVSPILKLFAKQLLTLKLCNRQTHSHLYGRHPNLKIWLKLLNISSNTFDVFIIYFFVLHIIVKR